MDWRLRAFWYHFYKMKDTIRKLNAFWHEWVQNIDGGIVVTDKLLTAGITQKLYLDGLKVSLK